MRVRRLGLAAWLMALPVTGLAQRAAVLPVDQALDDPEFFVFRARLQSIIAGRDTAALMSLVAADVLNSFGGDGGREEFREKWSLAEPAESALVGAGLRAGPGRETSGG